MEDSCFIGHIAGIKDVIGFHADTVKNLRKAFREAVDDYLATCEKLSKAPQRPYSGKIIEGASGNPRPRRDDSESP